MVEVKENSPSPEIQATDVGEAPEVVKTSAAAVSEVKYASFGARLLAMIIDVILVSVVLSVLGLGTMSTAGGTYSFNAGGPGTLIGLVYYVVMLAQFGATVGKMALKIKVQNIETGENLTYGQAALREVVGKFISFAAVLLGFFWVIWDPKKQAWHDKIAKSVVVKA